MSEANTKVMKYEDFVDYFYYDATSPSCLRWLKPTTSNIKVGDKAGVLSGSGYWQVTLKKKIYKVHRVIFLLFNKSLDSNKAVDHLNGNRTDNTIENLCEKSFANNKRNRKKSVNNKTGINGVRIYKNKQGREYALAYWYANGIRYEGSYFRLDLYAEGKALELAELERNRAIQNLIETGYNYTERHGK